MNYCSGSAKGDEGYQDVNNLLVGCSLVHSRTIRDALKPGLICYHLCLSLRLFVHQDGGGHGKHVTAKGDCSLFSSSGSVFVTR